MHSHHKFGRNAANRYKLYAPPDGKVVNIPSLLNELKDWAKKNPDFVQATSGWIMGNGYDDADCRKKASYCR